jgi:hypothetical protein
VSVRWSSEQRRAALFFDAGGKNRIEAAKSAFHGHLAWVAA